jgi:hypothetical protein
VGYFLQGTGAFIQGPKDAEGDWLEPGDPGYDEPPVSEPLVRRYSRKGAKLDPKTTTFRPLGLLISVDAGADCIIGFDGTGGHGYRVGIRFAALVGLYCPVEFLLLVLSDVPKTFAGGWHIVRKILLHLLQLCLNFSILVGANGHPRLTDVCCPFFVGAGHGSLQD